MEIDGRLPEETGRISPPSYYVRRKKRPVTRAGKSDRK
jgi:hypothetical protein